MDIYLSINNREQVIKLPIIPNEFTVNSPQSNEVYTTINQGDIKIIGIRGLKSITIESFFPAKNYDFLRDKSFKDWEYVSIIENWIDRKIPIRLIITDTPVNLAMTIDNFEYSIQNGSGDIYYSLALSEFKFINLTRKKV